MNRRTFLETLILSPALFFKPQAVQAQTGFDIAAAFANVPDFGVIDIPPGAYGVTDTLSLVNKQFITINGNNAFIYPVCDFTGKAIINMAGTKACNIHNMLVPAWSGNPLACLVLGRTAISDGGGNSFYNCGFSGSTSGANVYSVCVEGTRWNNCSFTTENDKPALIISSRDTLGYGLVESSNCLMYFDKCFFRNYGTAPALIISSGFVSGLVIRDSYMYLGNGGTGIQTETPTEARTYYLHLSDIRTEGNGNCLLIDNVGDYVSAWDIERIAWQISSDYIIRSKSPIFDSRFDFTFCAMGYAKKWLLLTNGAYLTRVQQIGTWTGKVVKQ